MRRPPLSPTRRRTGFTMIEILVVILIIAILMALLLPAINAAVNAANNARVAAEENNLQTALADFKNKYGEYPPSRIILHNNGLYNTSDTTQINGTSDLTLGDLNTRTVRALRKYFPRATAYIGGGSSVMVLNPTTGNPTAGWDGSGVAGHSFILQGDECLVFFLGGMPQKVSSVASGWGVTGFNRDPANPFNYALNAQRTVPLFEFAPQRLVDLDHDGFPSYIDPLSANNAAADQRPYAYFSAYGNNGYDPNDMNQGDSTQSLAGNTSAVSPEQTEYGSAFARQFYVSFVVGGSAGTRYATSTAPNPYTNGDAAPTTATTNTQWANPQTCQIISAGRDGLWGLGGAYDGSSTSNKLPMLASDTAGGVIVTPAPTAPDTIANEVTSLRKRERDNITNFSGGRLD